MSVNYEAAQVESRDYFEGDDLAADVFLGKYALRDELREVLESTPDQMHRRLARELARAESKYPNPLSEEEIYLALKDFKYIVPQGSPMSAIGNPYQLQSLSNCFVISPSPDSYGGIFKADQEQAQIMKRRGGVGHDISNIRPKGLGTKNAARTTDGIAVFMERYSNTCREVAQNGRRGALLLSISVHHPEVRTFINIKRDRKKVTGANISVRFTDEFFEAVEKGEKFQLRWPVEETKNPLISEWVDAKEIWDEFVEAAWDSAEPGALFWDTALRRSPADIYAADGFRSTSTNPCGEIILSNHDSCRLLLLNTKSFVDNPFTLQAKFDYKKFRQYVSIAQRLMDDVVDLEVEAVDKIIAKIKSDPEDDEVKRIEITLWENIKETALKGRRTGLGVTAIGDTLAYLGVKYGSPESVKVVEEIYKTMALGAYESSCKMAEERGAFLVYDYEKEVGHPFMEQLWAAEPALREAHKKFGRRNIALTTTAPCGSVSILTRSTSGIEPLFMMGYKRRKKVNPGDKDTRVDFVDELGDSWQEYMVYHPGVKLWMDITGNTDMQQSPYAGATANEIDWESGVDVQAAAQKWVCHAISRTTNLPKDATKEDVAKVYLRGWKSGCKGMTIYRDGSRSGVLVSESDDGSGYGSQKQGRPEEIIPAHAPKRPEALPCEIYHAQIKGVRWTIVVGLLVDNPYEVFVGHSDDLSLPNKCNEGRIIKRKKGCYDLHVDVGGDELVIKNLTKTFSNSESAWATRIISAALRHGTPIDFLVEQLQKDGNITDINKVIARLLKKYIKDGTEVRSSQSCLDCGSANLIYEEGCMKCLDCGSSKCG